MNLYEFENAFEELLDKALNELAPETFDKLLDSISMIVCDYEK